jgi:hypothetical protein
VSCETTTSGKLLGTVCSRALPSTAQQMRDATGIDVSRWLAERLLLVADTNAASEKYILLWSY